METTQLFDREAAGGVRRVTLNRLAAEIARAAAGIGRIAVEGEVVRPTRHPGGTYFTLKDRAAQLPIRCPARNSSRCRTVAGERVLVTGTLTWLNDRGQLQMVAEEVVPVGEGAIAALLAETRAALAADGLLDRPRRSIPRLPMLIGVVCGTEAAVRADIESVVAARFPGYPILFEATNVSGSGAADAIIRSLQALDARPEVDVIILARGGGDAAQLLPWSDDALCRAICAAATPIVSAIGHDGDRPLCDDVADLRCGTPSLAAGAVVPDRRLLHDEIGRLAAGRDIVLHRSLDDARRRLADSAPGAALSAGLVVARHRRERAKARLALVHPTRNVVAAAARLTACRRHLDALDPRRVLERGFAIVRDERGSVVRAAVDVVAGETVEIQIAAGRIDARVEGARDD